ncbi:MAG: VOC family protein [Thermomicrobiales bacterium]
MTFAPIPSGIRIGHISLGVSDLDRAVRFYRDVLGFDLRHADKAFAYFSASDYYHTIVLKAVESAGDAALSERSIGLQHFALNYPERRDLAAALTRVLDHGWSIDAAADYGTHEAIYLRDPDCNGIELGWDGDPTAWSRDSVSFDRKSLNFAGLLAELDDPSTAQYLPELATYT